MDACLLDTDILTEVFKGRNATVTSHATAHLQVHGQFVISEFTYFEVLRGLCYKKATKKTAAFEKLCQSMHLYPVGVDVLDRAADLWAEGRTLGQPHSDGDVIIAATALVLGRHLVTGNTAHFSWVPGLTLLDWR